MNLDRWKVSCLHVDDSSPVPTPPAWVHFLTLVEDERMPSKTAISSTIGGEKDANEAMREFEKLTKQGKNFVPVYEKGILSGRADAYLPFHGE